MSEELEQFNIHMEDIEQVDNLIENISLVVNELKKYTLTNRFEVILNNNLIETKDKLTNYRTILGCRITYDNLDRNVSFIVREDNKPSYEELENKLYKIKEIIKKVQDDEFYINLTNKEKALYEIESLLEE